MKEIYVFFSRKNFLHFVPHYNSLSWRKKVLSECYVNLNSPLAAFPPSIWVKCYGQDPHTNAFVAMAPVLYVHFLIFRLNLSFHLHGFVFMLLGKNIQTVVSDLAPGLLVTRIARQWLQFHCRRKMWCDTVRLMTNPYIHYYPYLS
jgi:hypothetical protein